MVDPKRSDETKEREEVADPNAAKQGGFGAFADRYRARWAADHPQMTRKWAGNDPTQSPNAAEPASTEPKAESEPASAADAGAADPRPKPGPLPETR